MSRQVFLYKNRINDDDIAIYLRFMLPIKILWKKNNYRNKITEKVGRMKFMHVAMWVDVNKLQKNRNIIDNSIYSLPLLPLM